MRRDNLQLAARFRDAMQFRHEPENVGNVLYHVTADDLFKLVIMERIRKDSEIVNDVSMTSRIHIDTDRAGKFVLATADVQNSLLGPGGGFGHAVSFWTKADLPDRRG